MTNLAVGAGLPDTSSTVTIGSPGTTELLSFALDGSPPDATTAGFPSMSADGRTVAFSTPATNLLGPGSDTNGETTPTSIRTDPADPLGVDALLFADGALDDVVLESIDAATGAITTLCPADEVSVAAGNAAFLRPESAAGTRVVPRRLAERRRRHRAISSCSSRSPAAPSQNLGLAATAREALADASSRRSPPRRARAARI